MKFHLYILSKHHHYSWKTNICVNHTFIVFFCGAQPLRIQPQEYLLRIYDDTVFSVFYRAVKRQSLGKLLSFVCSRLIPVIILVRAPPHCHSRAETPHNYLSAFCWDVYNSHNLIQEHQLKLQALSYTVRTYLLWHLLFLCWCQSTTKPN